MSQIDQSSQQVASQFIAGHDFNVFQPSIQLSDHQRMLNRARMIQRVQTIWINGILEPSLQGMISITPRIQIQPDAIRNPWQLVIQRVSQEGSMLPSGTHITWVYDRANGEVLILGEPGSGKTTLLLELARDLLERAQHDESLPIPVVFMLSSWANTRLPLAEWLISELHLRYQIPPLLAKTWVEEEQILPLLDGLDEVPLACRAACIETINDYRCAHGLLPTVVCCRLNDYQILPVRLQLSTAILVQPLTFQEVTGTLASADEKLIPIKRALQEDRELQTLVSNPLFLNILTVTYQHSPHGELLQHGLQHEQLLAAYVQQAIHHSPSTSQEAMHWLTNLARLMRQHHQSVFYLEQLQRDWLTSDKMRRVYDRVAVVLPDIVITILAYFFMQTFFSVTFQLTPFIIIWPIIFGGMLGCILAANRGGMAQQPEIQTQNNSRKRLVRLLLAAAITGLVVGLGGWWLTDARIDQEIKLGANQAGLSISHSAKDIIQVCTNHGCTSVFKIWYGLATGLIYFFVGIVLWHLIEKGKLRPSSSRPLTRDTWFQRIFSYLAVLKGRDSSERF
jgi:DNA polymerase III delta prime subunit